MVPPRHFFNFVPPQTFFGHFTTFMVWIQKFLLLIYYEEKSLLNFFIKVFLEIRFWTILNCPFLKSEKKF